MKLNHCHIEPHSCGLAYHVIGPESISYFLSFSLSGRRLTGLCERLRWRPHRTSPSQKCIMATMSPPKIKMTAFSRTCARKFSFRMSLKVFSDATGEHGVCRSSETMAGLPAGMQAFLRQGKSFAAATPFMIFPLLLSIYNLARYPIHESPREIPTGPG